VVHRAALLGALGRASSPLNALDLSRETGLSSIDVVPSLSAMLEDGVVARGERTAGAGRTRSWEYRITPSGSRELARRRPPRRSTGPAPLPTPWAS